MDTKRAASEAGLRVAGWLSQWCAPTNEMVQVNYCGRIYLARAELIR